ncbi:MAG: amidohydrolase family protein [Victivallales bacterium]|nr:amidohydrolase family protein [Victivallales bacterium]
MPGRILDAHVHIFGKDGFPPGFAFPPQNVYRRFSGEFTLPMWRSAMAELLPQQEVWLNCFGTPHEKADRDKVPPVNHTTEFCNVLVSPADSAEILQRRVEESRAVGVKPYLNYAATHYGKASNDVEVKDLLTPAQLHYLDSAGLAVTFHIPRKARFADPLNQRQMIELCGNYPNVKFIFAHIGRAYFMRNIRESNLEEFVQFPNAFFDTAMVNAIDIMRYTFDHFPAERVLFGTDSPIALLHGKSVEINHQYAYIMGEDYQIGTTIVDTTHAIDFTTFFYEQLRAVLEATPKGHLEDVLFNNARRVLKR